MVPERQKACHVRGRPNSGIRTWSGRIVGRNSWTSYYRARYYDPNAGRFFSEDPLGFGSEDTNFYAYVGNSAQNYEDPFGLCRILFNGSQISIETNNGSQKFGPFPASNKTVCDCGLKEGDYPFGKPQWLLKDGTETALGAQRFDANRSRHQAFGSARIPLDVPGSPGIMIHSRFPDPKNLVPTRGCVRVHDQVASSMAQFIDAVCSADGPNVFHFQRP